MVDESNTPQSTEPEPPPHRDTPVREPKQPGLPATLTLCGVIVAVYLLTSFDNGFQAPSRWAVAWGVFYPPLVADGQIWRFVTATLMHGSLSHLFNNAFGILIFGNLLEPVIGSWRLVGLYLLSGFFGMLASFYMLPEPTLGASAIDYGLIGCYLSLVLLIRYRTHRKLFMQELRGAVMFTVIFILWNQAEHETINLWGHVGGFVGGLLYAGWLSTRMTRQIASAEETQDPVQE